MTRQISPKSMRKAYSLVLVLLVVVVLLMMGTGLLSLGMQGQFTAIRAGTELKAMTAADAGLTQALFMMNQLIKDRTWNDFHLISVQERELPNADAAFSYEIGPESTGVLKSQHFITSMGTSGHSRKTVQANIGLKWLFESAILVKDRMSLMPNSIVTGYNSADLTDTDFSVKIGTTSIEADRIPIGPGTVIDADVFVGTGGDPATVIGAGGTITGRTYSLIQEVDFPVITAPALPVTGTALNATGATITLSPADSGQYTSINLAKGTDPGILEIAGGKVLLHITNNMDVGQGCELIVRPGSSLILYIDGNITADNSSGFNNEAGNVRDFQVYATGENQVFDFKAKSDTFKSGCTFYYDEALRDATLDDEGVRFVVKRWKE